MIKLGSVGVKLAIINTAQYRHFGGSVHILRNTNSWLQLSYGSPREQDHLKLQGDRLYLPTNPNLSLFSKMYFSADS